MSPGGAADDGHDMPASRGLIALLVATVAFFALWIVALKPGSSNKGSAGSPTHGPSSYQADVAAAHQAVQTSNADNARAGGDPTTTASTPTATTASTPVTDTATDAAKTHVVAPRTRHSSGTSASRLSAVQNAMQSHHVVAMLFFNPAATDDRAVRHELAVVPAHRGRVVKLTIPLSEIANYTAVTQQVPVNFSPTLVLVAPNGQADEIVGFSDRFEIAQRVDQALATR